VQDLLPAGGRVQGGPTGAAIEGGDGTLVLAMPAPGMSASVAITLSVSDEAVLAPTAAVRQIDGLYYVSVPGDDGLPSRREVTIGTSDGTNVEILAGLDAGETILLGAETEGIPLSVTQTAQTATQDGGGGFAVPGGGTFNRVGP
jgi:macrolide-specific efflux system membrane fusion protein